MKSAIKYFLVSASVIALMIASFIAGAHFRPIIWIDPPAIHSSSTIIMVSPPPKGPLYTTDDFSRANMAVSDFLNLKAEDHKYQHLDLAYFVTPDDMGYTTHTYSALKFKSAGRPFPKELEAEAGEVFKAALNQIQSEQDAPSNR